MNKLQLTRVLIFNLSCDGPEKLYADILVQVMVVIAPTNGLYNAKTPKRCQSIFRLKINNSGYPLLRRQNNIKMVRYVRSSMN